MYSGCFNSVSSGYRRRVIVRIPKSQTLLGPKLEDGGKIWYY